MSGVNISEEFREERSLSHGWVVVPSKTYPDRVYFYNICTKCSTWDNPCEPSNDGVCSKSPSEPPSVKKKKKRKKKKISKKCKKFKNNSTCSEKNSEQDFTIDDYDEQQDQYFDNVPINQFNFSQVNPFSPPSSSDSLQSMANSGYLDSSEPKNNTDNNTTKQLWSQFASTSDFGKKSVALSHLDGQSTSSNSSDDNVCNTSKERCHKTDKNKKDLANNTKSKKKNKKPSSEVGKKIFSFKIAKNTSFKIKDKTPAQSKLLQLRERNLELLRECGEIPKKSVSFKVSKNVSFKNEDKTPAQSKLFQLRDRNQVLVKECEATYTNSFPPRNSNCDNNLGQLFDEISSEPASGPTNQTFRQNDYDKEKCNGEGNNNDNNVQTSDFFEEMDWEPSSEELDVKNINVFRQQIDKTGEICNDISFALNTYKTPILPPGSNHRVLILDTNIFVSCLNFVRELRDTNIPGVGFPVLYIPWRVLQELDRLKDSKLNSLNKQLNCNVRKAINYLNESFKSRHPRCVGQSFENFSKMVDVDNYAPDDQILQTCIQLNKLHPDMKLTLLTNDKNLESKAIVSNVESYSKEEFQKKFLSSSVNVESVEYTSGTMNTSNVSTLQCDEVVCELKSILKNLFCMVVEKELEIAFEKHWPKVAFKKPPWTLQDVLTCFIKHWRSVFFLVFPKEALEKVQKLYDGLFKKEPDTSDDVYKIVKLSMKLTTFVEQLLEKGRPYSELVDATVTKLSKLLECLQRKSQDTGEPLGMNSAQPSSQLFSTNNRRLSDFEEESLTTSFISVSSSGISNPSSEVLLAKNLFRHIWDSLRSFCVSVTDIINSSVPNNSMVVQETRLRLSQILSEANELVACIEKILEISLENISPSHPVISHLSEFLIQLFSLIMPPETREKLSKCLAAFCCDLEGRSLLSRSLNDFKDFTQELLQAAEYFERNYSTL